MDLVLITALGVGGATAVGAVVGFAFKKVSHTFSDIVLSFAAGVMLAAAVLGLVLPSLDYGGKFGLLITVAGIFAGALCLNLIDRIVPHLHKMVGVDIEAHHNALHLIQVFGHGKSLPLQLTLQGIRAANIQSCAGMMLF